MLGFQCPAGTLGFDGPRCAGQRDITEDLCIIYTFDQTLMTQWRAVDEKVLFVVEAFLGGEPFPARVIAEAGL